MLRAPWYLAELTVRWLVWCLSQAAKKKNMSRKVRCGAGRRPLREAGGLLRGVPLHRWRRATVPPRHITSGDVRVGCAQVVAQLTGLATCCGDMLRQTSRLVEKVKLPQGVITDLIDLCTKALLVQGSDVLGLQLHCTALLQVRVVRRRIARRRPR